MTMPITSTKYGAEKKRLPTRAKMTPYPNKTRLPTCKNLLYRSRKILKYTYMYTYMKKQYLFFILKIQMFQIFPYKQFYILHILGYIHFASVKGPRESYLL